MKFCFALTCSCKALAVIMIAVIRLLGTSDDLSMPLHGDMKHGACLIALHHCRDALLNMKYVKCAARMQTAAYHRLVALGGVEKLKEVQWIEPVLIQPPCQSASLDAAVEAGPHADVGEQHGAPDTGPAPDLPPATAEMMSKLDETPLPRQQLENAPLAASGLTLEPLLEKMHSSLQAFDDKLLNKCVIFKEHEDDSSAQCVSFPLITLSGCSSTSAALCATKMFFLCHHLCSSCSSLVSGMQFKQPMLYQVNVSAPLLLFAASTKHAGNITDTESQAQNF